MALLLNNLRNKHGNVLLQRVEDYVILFIIYFQKKTSKYVTLYHLHSATCFDIKLYYQSSCLYRAPMTIKHFIIQLMHNI